MPKETPRTARKLPVNATKEELRLAHKVKMAMKKIVRQRLYEHFSGPGHTTANISAHHPDAGMSFSEHYTEKDKRQHVL